MIARSGTDQNAPQGITIRRLYLHLLEHGAAHLIQAARVSRATRSTQLGEPTTDALHLPKTLHSRD
jgi:hypothetical protein